MDRKRLVIVTLACANVVLLAALVLVAAAPPAYGQAFGTDYLVVSGHVAQEWDAVYVVDLASRKLVAMAFDKSTKRIKAFGGGRDLKVDFGRTN